MFSLVIPTYNEAQSLPQLLAEIRTVLGSIDYEVIVVDDDSPDQTWAVAERLGADDHRIRVVRRTNERGLSSAVVTGFAAASGDVLAVMDSDGQHDPAQLPALLAAVQRGADVAVASRYREGGSTGEWVESRRIMSRVGTWVTRRICPAGVTDPLSGYFVLRRTSWEGVRAALRPSGFKILLEILAALPPTARVGEVPLVFRQRIAGHSKLTFAVQLAFGRQLLRLMLRQMGVEWTVWLLLALCIAMFLWLLPRALALSPLYANRAMPQQAEQTLRFHADREGWLLSDVLLQRVAADAIEVLHRRHRRGTDDETCLRLFFDLSPPQPCDASSTR
ncbi:MAG: dolichol-phosphate mannosyltransferase [Candidatus Peregrinibacteria bacterium Gr01-1014_25]|nr:MAG: dolichol-phosphate mannosyltransferase [Candidatus Peregrinibacteria bacterium Gr01-1014_25]